MRSREIFGMSVASLVVSVVVNARDGDLRPNESLGLKRGVGWTSVPYRGMASWVTITYLAGWKKTVVFQRLTERIKFPIDALEGQVVIPKCNVTMKML